MHVPKHVVLATLPAGNSVVLSENAINIIYVYNDLRNRIQQNMSVFTRARYCNVSEARLIPFTYRTSFL
jgi:hypothetical protein